MPFLQEMASMLDAAGDLATLFIAYGIYQIHRITVRMESLERRVLLVELQNATPLTELARKGIIEKLQEEEKKK